MEFYCLEDLRRCSRIPHAKEIHDFIKGVNCSTLSAEEILIKSKELFVRVGEYVTEPQEQKCFEAHRIYADVQYIVSGIEVIGVTAETFLPPLGGYDPHSDIQFFESPKRFSQLVVSSGECAVFFPHEAHRPGCIYQDPSRIKKLVFKVKI